MKKPRDVELSSSSGCATVEGLAVVQRVAAEQVEVDSADFQVAVEVHRVAGEPAEEGSADFQVVAVAHRLAETLADVGGDNHGHA